MPFGASGVRHSPHFFDQATLYSSRQFKTAWFTSRGSGGACEVDPRADSVTCSRSQRRSFTAFQADALHLSRSTVLQDVPRIDLYHRYPRITAYALAKNEKAPGEIRKVVVQAGHHGPKEINVQPEFLAWLRDPRRAAPAPSSISAATAPS